ncbi:uncharacterized protein METZ01_LOCUS469166, partial [marine metagenome]
LPYQECGVLLQNWLKSNLQKADQIHSILDRDQTLHLPIPVLVLN